MDFVNLDQYNQYMTWIERDAALSALAVKPQTLYAYVSRGRIKSKAHPEDPRASLYLEADINTLLEKRRRGRSRSDIASAAIAWGDPVMETRITTVRSGRLIYRGQDATKFAEDATLEETAALLWGVDSIPLVKASKSALSETTGKGRAMAFLAARAAGDIPMAGRTHASFVTDGAELMAGFARAVSGAKGRGMYHQRLARLWQLDPVGTDLLRRALVLVADHELNPSTFAARIAASTGAPLAACALSGCAVLAGPRHGEASARALEFLKSARREGPKRALIRLAEMQAAIPATGHPLYPNGDPRAKALLNWMKLPSDLKRAIQAAEQESQQEANVDMALAAMCLTLELPDDAPFLIFASGRLVGWIAHAIEQALSGEFIRPRAHYSGD